MKKQMEKTGTPSLDELMKACEKNLIGLWRFRELNKIPRWCTTFAFQGNYYDVQGKKTPHKALQETLRQLEILKEKANRKKKRKTTARGRVSRAKRG